MIDRGVSYVANTIGVHPDTQSPLWRRIEAIAAARQAERDRAVAEEAAKERLQEEARQQARDAIRQRNFKLQMAQFGNLSIYLKNTQSYRILQEVAAKHGIAVSQLRVRQHGAVRSAAYQEACYRLSIEAGMSASVIGARLGRRDHTTILRAIKIHAERNGLPLVREAQA